MANRWAPWVESLVTAALQDFTLATPVAVTTLVAAVTAKVATAVHLLWILDVTNTGAAAPGLVADCYKDGALFQSGPVAGAAAWPAGGGRAPLVAAFVAPCVAGVAVTYDLRLTLVAATTTYRVGSFRSSLTIFGLPSQGVAY